MESLTAMTIAGAGPSASPACKSQENAWPGRVSEKPFNLALFSKPSFPSGSLSRSFAHVLVSHLWSYYTVANTPHEASGCWCSPISSQTNSTCTGLRFSSSGVSSSFACFSWTLLEEMLRGCRLPPPQLGPVPNQLTLDTHFSSTPPAAQGSEKLVNLGRFLSVAPF